MGKFIEQSNFSAPFGTTTSDGFHADSDAIRFEPDWDTTIITGGSKMFSGEHASVETAILHRPTSITLNGKTYKVENTERDKWDQYTGDINLGTIDLSSTISGITVQSAATSGTSVSGRAATISLVPSNLVYNASTGNLTITNEFGGSGATIELGIHQILENATYSGGYITLKFNGVEEPMKINVSDLIDEYSGDGSTIEYVQGTTTAFTLSQSVKNTLSGSISAITVNNSAVTVTNKVAAITLPEPKYYDADEQSIHKNPISGDEHPNEWFSVIPLTDEELAAMMERVGLIVPPAPKVRMFYTSTEDTDASSILGVEAQKVE